MYTVICCDLSVHVFINCVSMVTKVAVSRLEVAQRVTLPLTSTHSCSHLSFCLCFSTSIFLSQMPICHPPHTHTPSPELPDRKRVGNHTRLLKNSQYFPPFSCSQTNSTLCITRYKRTSNCQEVFTGIWSRRSMSRLCPSLTGGWWCPGLLIGACHSHWR